MNATPILELRKLELKRLGAVSKVSNKTEEDLVLNAGVSDEGGSALTTTVLTACLCIPMQIMNICGK